MFVVEFSCEDILELCVEHCGAKCFVSQNSLVCLLFYALLVIVIKDMGFAACIFVYMSLSLSRACGLSLVAKILQYPLSPSCFAIVSLSPSLSVVNINSSLEIFTCQALYW